MNLLKRLGAWFQTSERQAPSSILRSSEVNRTYCLMGLGSEGSSLGTAAWGDIPNIVIGSFIEVFNNPSRWTQGSEPYVQFYAEGDMYQTFIAGPAGYDDIGSFVIARGKIRPNEGSRATITPNGVVFACVRMELTIEDRVNGRALSTVLITITPDGELIVVEG